MGESDTCIFWKIMSVAQFALYLFLQGKLNKVGFNSSLSTTILSTFRLSLGHILLNPSFIVYVELILFCSLAAGDILLKSSPQPLCNPV